MSGKVTGGPTHWRANLDELTLGAGHLRQATADTLRLAGEATVAGGLVAGVTIMTPQGPLIGVNTVKLSTGLIAMRAEVELLSKGVEHAVAAYLEAEAQITNLATTAAPPAAVGLRVIGATTDVNVPSDVYELDIRGAKGYPGCPI